MSPKRAQQRPRLASLIRPHLRRLHAYVPGEQPKVPGLIKLNTNENPQPPAPNVLDAVRAAVDGRLRLYPNPTAQPLRNELANLHGCAPENIVIGNGSDELLALATRAFVEPVPQPETEPRSAGRNPRQLVQFFHPSYSLYPILADIHRARVARTALRADFGLPTLEALSTGGSWDFDAALAFVTTPNAPGGRGYRTADLEALCLAQKGVVILDEAYVDFAGENAMELALRHPHVIVSRTFSKAYSLCFQRIGYFVGHPELISAIDRIRDSYNVNGLGQVAALATLENLDYYRRNFRALIATRDEVAERLIELGFDVLPSQTNFVLASPPTRSAGEWFEALRNRGILVRWFDKPKIRKWLRITIGSPDEMERFLEATEAIR